MKKLDRFILGAYLSPFLRAFGVSLFILVIQFLSQYKDEIFGKGLEVVVLGKIFAYAMVSLLVLALPVSVLLSSLMTLGNFGANYELAAMRSSGVSLPRILRPMLVVTILISVGSFLLSNYVVTKANLKLHSLLYDVKQVKPTFTLKPGHFYKDIEGYVIRIADKSLEREMLYDVIIYDHTQGRGNDRITVADSGRMVINEQLNYMEMTLFNGVNHEAGKSVSKSSETVWINSRYYFDTLYYEFDLKGFGIERTPEELFATHQFMLNLAQLNVAKDSILERQDYIKGLYSDKIKSFIMVDSSVFKLEIPAHAEPGKSMVAYFPDHAWSRIYKSAIQTSKSVVKSSRDAQALIEAQKGSYRDYEIEYHGKFSLPVSCLIFLLIGAPIGAIIRKGGVGIPILVSVVFYLLFYIIMLQGKKMAQEAVMPVWVGVWLPVFVMVPIALFVTYESTSERKLLDNPKLYRGLVRIRSFLVAINPLALLLRIKLVRRAVASMLRVVVSLRSVGRATRETPIMERLRKLRERGRSGDREVAAEESPIERRLREMRERKAREEAMGTRETGQHSPETTVPEDEPVVETPATREETPVTYESELERETAESDGIHWEVAPPSEPKGLFARILAFLGLRKPARPRPATGGLTTSGETPIERRLRELREKKEREAASGAEVQPQEPQSEDTSTESPIEKRLRELREKKAREAAEAKSKEPSDSPETPESEDSVTEIPSDEKPIEKRLRELRERKAREAAEAKSKETSDSPETPESEDSVPEIPSDEKPIEKRLRELRERKAREAAEAKSKESSDSPETPESEESVPEIGSDEKPIEKRLRELRERKAREAAEATSKEARDSPETPEAEPDEFVFEPLFEPIVEQFPDREPVDTTPTERVEAPAFEWDFEALSGGIEPESVEIDRELKAPQVVETAPLLDWDLGPEEVSESDSGGLEFNFDADFSGQEDIADAGVAPDPIEYTGISLAFDFEDAPEWDAEGPNPVDEPEIPPALDFSAEPELPSAKNISSPPPETEENPKEKAPESESPKDETPAGGLDFEWEISGAEDAGPLEFNEEPESEDSGFEFDLTPSEVVLEVAGNDRETEVDEVDSENMEFNGEPDAPALRRSQEDWEPEEEPEPEVPNLPETDPEESDTENPEPETRKSGGGSFFSRLFGRKQQVEAEPDPEPETERETPIERRLRELRERKAREKGED